MKRALIVAATGGFLNGFLIPDMKLLQEMGYEVHCAANGNSVSTFVPEERFASIGVTFHQIDFSSTSPVSKESLTAYKQYKELLNRYHFDFVHVHTPIPGAIVRMATRRKRKRGCVVVYTTHGLTFPKGSSLKTKIVYGSVEWFCSWMTDGIITINWEDYAQMKKMRCKNVYHINGVGVDTSRYHECQIDRETYRKSLGLSENDIAILEVVQILFSNFAITIVTANLQFIHAVRMLGEQSLELVNQNPGSRLPDILVHSRADRTNHPAVTVAATNLCTNLLGLRTVPQLIPGLIVQVAHDFLILGTIARHNIAIRINEEGIKAHVARQQTLLAVDVVDQAVVEVSTEPLFRAVTTEQFVDQILEILSNHRAVVNDVLCLNKVEAVVQRSSCELHAHLIGDFIQWNQVRSIFILNGHTKADILHAHLTQLLQCAVTTLVAVLQTTNLVVGLLQTFDRDTNTDLRELLAQVNDTVGEETIRGNNDTVRLLVQFAHDILQVGADERLTAGDIGKVHLRQLLNGFDADFLFRLRRCFIAVAHGATSVAAVSDDDRTI